MPIIKTSPAPSGRRIQEYGLSQVSEAFATTLVANYHNTQMKYRGEGFVLGLQWLKDRIAELEQHNMDALKFCFGLTNTAEGDPQNGNRPYIGANSRYKKIVLVAREVKFDNADPISSGITTFTLPPAPDNDRIFSSVINAPVFDPPVAGCPPISCN